MKSVVEIETDLSLRQLSKFKILFKEKKLINGKVYFPTSQMHGVLLTQSKQSALNIIQRHLRFVQPYIENINDDQYLKHIGADVLLDRLGEENPKKKTQYWAARAYISAYLANSPEIFKDAELAGQKLDKEKIKAVQVIKKGAKRCALSEKDFEKGVECHIHHVEGVSERPDLASDPKNLIALCEDVHREYHAWVNSRKESVTRATLKQFARAHNYKTDW